MAGYYSEPLVLSVQMGPSIEEGGAHKHYVEIVVGIRDCDAVVWNPIHGNALTNLDVAQRLEYVASRVDDAVKGIEETCKVAPIAPVPTDELIRLFLAPSALANDP
jgi:hypothetical protein